MIFRLLGEVEIHDPDGRPVPLPGGHARIVLVSLLIRPNQRVSPTELVRAVWGEDGPPSNQIYKQASAIRTILRRVGLEEALETVSRSGYRLHLSGDQLDVLAFRRSGDLADAAERDGDRDEEIRHLRDAIRLWRGPEPLAGIDSTAFEREVSFLKSRRKRLAVRLFKLESDRSAYAAILDDLMRFASEDPADGQYSELLMRALYVMGHARDAADAYERHARALEATTGGRPDKRLRDLYYSYGGQQAGTKAETPLRDARPVPTPRQLPPAAADYVGRADLRAEVTWLLSRSKMPVLAVSGPGGIGKTALALRAAQDEIETFPDGQLWAELYGTTERPADPAEVLAQFLRALDVPTVPESRQERAALFRSLLADRRALIVLDDAVSGSQVRDLVPGGTRCVVLITARRRLPDIRGGVHHVTPLKPFEHNVAEELFRIIVEGAHVDLAGEDEDVREVVRMCRGLPLALRIAAALRVEHSHRPTADLRRRLLAEGPAAFEYGDESLSRTLSAGLLQLDGRVGRLFLLLGLLRGPTFGEWTAAALLGVPGPAAAEALSQLAAVSMVEPVGVRYRLHDLTREYSRRRAEAELSADERVAAELRAMRALLTLVRHAHASLYGASAEVVHSDLPDVPVPTTATDEIDADASDWFDRERRNVRAAVERAAALDEVDLCWDLAVSSHEFYTLGRYFDDWRVTHGLALQVARRAGNQRAEGVVLAMLGQPPLVASGTPGVSGVSELQEAARLLAAAGDRHGRAIALRTLGNALRRGGELSRPLAAFREALADYEASGDRVGAQQAMRFIGQIQFDRDDLDAAWEMYAKAEALARTMGHARVLAQTRYWVGRVAIARGDLDAARAAFQDVASVFSDDRGPGRAYALHGRGELALAEGDLGEARSLVEEAARLAHESDDVILEGRAALALAEMEKRRGASPGKRLAPLSRAIACFQACGAVHLEVRAQSEVAKAYEAMDDAESAAGARDRIDYLYAAIPPEDRLPGR